MPVPECDSPTMTTAATSAATAPIVAAWSKKDCAFLCPSGSSYKPAPIFSYPFCHPFSTGLADKTRWEHCNPVKLGNECPTDCAYDNFADLIPVEKDFCVISMMNPDINSIMGCLSKQNLASCSTDNQCRWFKGKKVAANNELPSTGAVLFKDNFCHPANLVGIDKSLSYCLKETTKDTCSTKGCVWSVGESLRSGAGVCSAAIASEQTADLLMSCP
jgi:hypothetical protein